jgi:hypothetical protein
LIAFQRLIKLWNCLFLPWVWLARLYFATKGMNWKKTFWIHANQHQIILG